jgi:hypothetical protein
MAYCCRTSQYDRNILNKRREKKKMRNLASYIRKRPITRSLASGSPRRTVTPAARTPVTNWAPYITKRPITRSLASVSPRRTVTPAARRTVTNWAPYITKRPITRSLASVSPRRTVTPAARRTVTPLVRPLSTSSVRPTYGIPPPTLTAATGGGALTNGGLGFDLSGITGQLQGTGQEIVDKIQSFLPTAFKLLLVFIGIKILLWFLGRRR